MNNPSMNATTRRATLAALLLVCSVAAGVHADEGTPSAKAPAGPGARAPMKPASSDPLAGPSVKPVKSAATLIERDAEGRVIRLEVNPAEAAAAAATLSPESRTKVNDVIVQQAATIDTIVRDHLGDVVRLAQVFQSGTQAEKIAAFGELNKLNAPVRQRGALVDQFAKVITKEEGEQVRVLVRDYYAALVKDEEAHNPKNGRAASNLMIAEQIKVLGNEIKRSYERVIGQQTKDFDDLLKSLNLSPEQDAKVRGLVTDLVQKRGAKASGGDKVKVVMKIAALLDEEQKKILYAKIAEARGDQTATRTEKLPIKK
ncbi:hypothetical protein BH11PLA1_BH11PLA1_21800 [soil metagenome]